MKAIRIFLGSISESFKGVFRNFSLSLASVVCITITLIIVGLSLVISKNINSITHELESELEIVAFVSNDADSFDITSVETQIKGIENVDTDNVTYKTKAEIKGEMMESNDTFENIMKDWDDEENPPQNIFIVKVKDAKTNEYVSDGIITLTLPQQNNLTFNAEVDENGTARLVHNLINFSAKEWAELLRWSFSPGGDNSLGQIDIINNQNISFYIFCIINYFYFHNNKTYILLFSFY